MPFKILRDLVFVVPVDLAAVESKPKNETFAIKNTKKTSSLQWKVVSVGAGAQFFRDGQMIHVPIPLNVGDIVILVLDDNQARNVWATTEVYLNDQRGLSVAYDRSVIAVSISRCLGKDFIPRPTRCGPDLGVFSSFMMA